MVGFFIDFQWFKDSKGYRILPPKGLRGERIVRNGGDLIAYRPLEKIDVLYALLARVETTNDLLDFIGRYGPLTRFGLSPNPPPPPEARHVKWWSSMVVKPLRIQDGEEN